MFDADEEAWVAAVDAVVAAAPPHTAESLAAISAELDRVEALSFQARMDEAWAQVQAHLRAQPQEEPR